MNNNSQLQVTTEAGFSLGNAAFSQDKGGENKTLYFFAKAWFGVATLGLFIFSYYLLAFYGVTGVAGDFEKWNGMASHGYIEGDLANNVAFALHALLAVIVLIGGPLQLIPHIREKAPVFHRWNGRVYLITMLIIITAGLYSNWSNDTHSEINRIGVSINGLIIFAFAYMAFKHAIGRDFYQHRKWAMRLFVASCGVWFFRIGLMFWIVIHQKPVGFDPETFTGPFLSFLVFAQFLIPLAILEGYFRAQETQNKLLTGVMTFTLGVSVLITAIGIFAASAIMWLPRI